VHGYSEYVRGVVGDRKVWLITMDEMGLGHGSGADGGGGKVMCTSISRR